MVCSQRVCKRHFQGYLKAQRTDFDEQGYRQYSHIVRVRSTLEASIDCLRIREQCAYPLACTVTEVTTISCVKVRANAKIDFVSCLEQDSKRRQQETGCYLSRGRRRYSCHGLK